jgi:hypothetical protein
MGQSVGFISDFPPELSQDRVLQAVDQPVLEGDLEEVGEGLLGPVWVGCWPVATNTS